MRPSSLARCIEGHVQKSARGKGRPKIENLQSAKDLRVVTSAHLGFVYAKR